MDTCVNSLAKLIVKYCLSSRGQSTADLGFDSQVFIQNYLLQKDVLF